MNVPGLGEVTNDGLGWYYSEPVRVAMLDQKCRIVLEGYDEDPCQEDYHAAIANFLSSSPSVLKQAETHIYQYYLDLRRYFAEEELAPIASPAGVWTHVRFGDEPFVSRRAYGDEGIYISLSGNCDWEPEHGLQIVFREGKEVCKVGPFDGHFTNSDAYADQSLEHVIYRSLG